MTERGEEQALRVSKLWEKLKEERVLFPQKFYSSPLKRSVHTAMLTFGELDLPGWEVVTMKGLKGRLVLEDGDGEWMVERKESDEEMDVRVGGLLDNIFENDECEIISLTSHGGFIASMFRVTGHRKFDMPTGGVIPMLVRAETTGDADEDKKKRHV